MFRWTVILATLAAFPLEASDELAGELEVAARKFRINVYSTYRNHRENYDTLMQTGESVLALWQQHQNDQTAKIVRDWFLEAGEAVTTYGQRLPTRPSLEKLVLPRKKSTYRESNPSSPPARWPMPPDRRSSVKPSWSPTESANLLLAPLLPKVQTGVDLANAELEVNPTESPIPAFSFQQDLKRREFGSSIDLNMLIARIESENLRLKLLEERLIQADKYSTGELKLVSAEFNEIVQNRRLTELYWGNLGREQKQLIPRPLSLKPIESLLDRLRASAL